MSGRDRTEATPMGNRMPKPWSVLRDDDGDSAIIVPSPDTSVIDALLEAICQVHGDQFEADNPVIVEAAKDLKVERWHSCTVAWKESNPIDDPEMDWWSPDGDGKRTIYVVPIERSLYDIGDDAADVVEADANV